MKPCPFCAEEIQDAAIACKHCGRDLAAPSTVTTADRGGREAGLYCETCKRQTLHIRPQPNHVMHFLIGLLTCTLWWWVWLFLVIANASPRRCTVCGTPEKIERPPIAATDLRPAERASLERTPAERTPLLSPGVKKALLLAVLSFGFLISVGIAWVVWHGWKEARHEAALQLHRTRVTTILNTQPQDLDALKDALAVLLNDRKYTCGTASALEKGAESGAWVVRCSSGHSYSMTFDDDGKLLRSIRSVP